MDEATKQKLEQTQRSVPRYLFRTWRAKHESGFDPSGGFEGLNTDTAITPLAFHRGTGNKDVYTLTQTQFTNIITQHLLHSRSIETQFSSWSPSLAYVLNHFARWLSFNFMDNYLDQVYISIVDTKQCDNLFIHIPAIEFMGTPSGFAWEYLAHGVISGSAYQALPVRHFVSAGVYRKEYDPLGDTLSLPIREITQQDIVSARVVGECYGEAFALPMTLAILCMYKHKVDHRSLIFNGVEGLRIPHSWRYDETITGDTTYNEEGVEDVEQMRHLMRALAT